MLDTHRYEEGHKFVNEFAVTETQSNSVDGGQPALCSKFISNDGSTPIEQAFQCMFVLWYGRFLVRRHRLHVDGLANYVLYLVTSASILNIAGECPLANAPIADLTRLEPVIVARHLGATPDGGNIRNGTGLVFAMHKNPRINNYLTARLTSRSVL